MWMNTATDLLLRDEDILGIIVLQILNGVLYVAVCYFYWFSLA